MKNITLTCPECHQSTDLLRDSSTGLWELPNRYSTISNISWKYLEEMWLASHAQACEKKPKPRFSLLHFSRKSA